MYVHLDNMKRENPSLYHTLAQRGFTAGIREVDPESFPPETRRELMQWKDAQQDRNKLPAAERQKALDGARGTERLHEYMALGLVDSATNAEKIIAYLSGHCDSYVSVENVDKAVHGLGRAQLEWQEVKPAEVLGTLPNGEAQLPLDISPAMLRKGSVAQLKDWHKRKHAESPVARIAGRFAANIF